MPPLPRATCPVCRASVPKCSASGFYVRDQPELLEARDDS